MLESSLDLGMAPVRPLTPCEGSNNSLLILTPKGLLLIYGSESVKNVGVYNNTSVLCVMFHQMFASLKNKPFKQNGLFPRGCK